MITVPYYTSDAGARLNCHLRRRAGDHLGLRLLGIAVVFLVITPTPMLLGTPTGSIWTLSKFPTTKYLV
jgi:hypothetical protein